MNKKTIKPTKFTVLAFLVSYAIYIAGFFIFAPMLPNGPGTVIAGVVYTLIWISFTLNLLAKHPNGFTTKEKQRFKVLFVFYSLIAGIPLAGFALIIIGADITDKGSLKFDLGMWMFVLGLLILYLFKEFIKHLMNRK